MENAKQPSDRPELLPRKKAAAYIGLAPHTLAVWASTGRVPLPYIKIGRLVSYRREDLDAFLAANTQNAGASSAGASSGRRTA